MLEPQILSSSKMLLWQTGRRAGTGSFTFVGSTTALPLPLPLPGQNMLCQEKMQYMHQLYMHQLLCINYICSNFYAPTICTNYQPACKHRRYETTTHPPSEWVTGGSYTGEILAHLKTQWVPQNSCCVSSCPEKPNMYTIYYIFMWHILHIYMYL